MVSVWCRNNLIYGFKLFLPLLFKLLLLISYALHFIPLLINSLDCHLLIKAPMFITVLVTHPSFIKRSLSEIHFQSIKLTQLVQTFISGIFAISIFFGWSLNWGPFVYEPTTKSKREITVSSCC